MFIAEAEIKGEFDKGIDPIIDLMESMRSLSRASIGDRVENFLAYKREAFLAHKEMAVRDSIALQRESSALALINAYVEDLKTNSRAIGSAQSQEYVAAGAELSSDLYLGLYIIASG